MKYNKKKKSNITNEYVTIGIAMLTEVDAEILNASHNDVIYELAEDDSDKLVYWEDVDGIMTPTLSQGVTIAKMGRSDLEENFPNIAETQPDNVKDFRIQVLATYENLK